MDERRKDRRNRTFLHGQIGLLNCTVRNLSREGALLEFPEAITVPVRFDLAIRHKGDSRPARIVWRSGSFVGTAFEHNPSESVISLESARRIRILEAERDVLMQRIRQMDEPA